MSFCHNTAPTRRGMNLIEVSVSIVVLGAALLTTAQVLRWTALQERAAEKRRCAIEAANGLLDRFTAQTWDAITPSSARTLALPVEAARNLGQTRLAVSVDEEHGAPSAKRVSLSLGWGPTGPGRSDEVRLTTWVYRREVTK